MNHERIHTPYNYYRFAVLIGLVLITILLLTLFDAEEQIRDSLSWAVRVENSVDISKLFNPHHLLYMPINRLIYLALSPLFDTFSGLDAGRLHSILWACVMVVSMFYLIEHLTKSMVLGVIAAIMLLTTKSVWVYSLQAQAYAPTIGSFTLLTATIVLHGSKPLTAPWILVFSMLLSLCIFFHQAFVILCIPLAYFIIATQGPGRVKVALSIIGLSGIVVLSTYILVFMATNEEWTIKHFFRYLTLYGSMQDPAYFSFANFSKQGITNLSESLLDTITITPWQLRAGIWYTFLITVGSIVIWNIIQAVRQAEAYQVRIYALIIAIGFWLLCLWGNPLDDAWPMFILMPLLMMGFLTVNDIVRKLSYNKSVNILLFAMLTTLAAGISARNLAERILPMHHSKGPNYVIAQKISDVVPAECITFEPRQAVTQNLSYYHGRRNRDVWDLLSYYYFDPQGELPFTWANFSFEHIDCFAIASRFLSPYFTVSGVDGNSEPKGWLSYIARLLELKYDENRNIYKHRKIQVVNDRDGDSYYIVFIDTIEYSDLKDLFEFFDNNLTSSPDGKIQPFQDWLRANSSFAAAL